MRLSSALLLLLIAVAGRAQSVEEEKRQAAVEKKEKKALAAVAAGDLKDETSTKAIEEDRDALLKRKLKALEATEAEAKQRKSALKAALPAGPGAPKNAPGPQAKEAGRGGSSGAGIGGVAPSATRPPVPGTAEAATSAAADRSERAAKRARRAADSMRVTTPDLGETKADPTVDKPPRGSKPATRRDDRALALEGKDHPDLLAGLGLKIGAGTRGAPEVQDEDGAPADEEELEELDDALDEEPVQASRRPDFFEKISRERFEGLKDDLTAPPSERPRALDDMELSEDKRDVEWSATCAPLSGSCNPAAGGESYKKGTYVPPEALARAADAEEEEEEEPEEDDEPTAAAAPAAKAGGVDYAAKYLGDGRSPSPMLAALLAKMGGALSALTGREAPDERAAAAASSAEAAETSAPPSRGAVPAGAAAPAADRGGRAARAPASASRPFQGRAPAPVVSRASVPAPGRSPWSLVWLLACLVVAVSVVRRK